MKDNRKNLSIALIIAFALIVPQVVYLLNLINIHGSELIPWPLFFVLEIGLFSICVMMFYYVVRFLRNLIKKK